jgi:hypothetical protein
MRKTTEELEQDFNELFNPYLSKCETNKELLVHLIQSSVNEDNPNVASWLYNKMSKASNVIQEVVHKKLK